MHIYKYLEVIFFYSFLLEKVYVPFFIFRSTSHIFFKFVRCSNPRFKIRYYAREIYLECKTLYYFNFRCSFAIHFVFQVKLSSRGIRTSAFQQSLQYNFEVLNSR